ncbi:MAG TPA: phage holin family protein [Treponemataceae bacterium]|nr:phage holin family protein [Treponemataceae bacterium]HQL04771.1 phage holin family protein [Treponemataceae bacterium]
MNKLLIKYIGIVAVLYIASAVMKGLTIQSDVHIFIFALVIFASSLIIRPLLLVVLMPFNLLTGGILTILANTLTILFSDLFLPFVSTGGFLNCVLISLPVYLLYFIINTASRSPRLAGSDDTDVPPAN